MPSLPLRGARTENTNSAVPPCLPENSDRSAERQHALCPLTLALRQKILRGSPLFSLPSAAHLLPRSSPRSQPPGLSVDALAALLPLRWFGRYLNCSFYTSGLSVCQALFFAWEKHFLVRQGAGRFSYSPRMVLAKRKYTSRDRASTMVVMKGEAMTAGSKPSFLASRGRVQPTILAHDDGDPQGQADDQGPRKG